MFFQRSAVAQARPPAINDRLLAQLTRIANDAPHSLATEAECEWLISTCGPLLDELAKRRAVMASMGYATDTANIVLLRAGP